MTLKPVDTAIIMVVGPCIDDTDFKSLEESIAYNAAGMDISLIIEKSDGTTAVTTITLTSGGTSDWTHKDGGYYEVEITAVQNAEEGIAYLRGICTGVLPFESSRYEIVKANIYDSLIKGTDILQTDIIQLGGVTQSLTDLKDFVDDGYDPSTNKITGTTDMRGTNSAYTGTPPTVIEIRTEMDSNSVDLNAILIDTNELQLNQGNWLTAAGFSTHSAADIWNVGIRALTDKSGFDLSTAGINKIWDDLLSGMSQVGSIGKLISDNLNATITSRAVSGEYNTQMGYIPSDLGNVPTAAELNTAHGSGNWITATGFSISNEYDTVIAALQTDLDNPNQYKADISNLDVAVSTRSSHTAANVWTVTTRSLTDKVDFALSTSGIKAIWDQAVNVLTTVGSISKLIIDNLNATISSRAPSSEYDTEMGRLDVAISTRNDVTPNIVIPDVAGTAATLHGITDGKIDVMDAIVDAIKIKTDNLPSGITKNEALPKFDFLMVLSSDHVSAATGKTITGEISKDGGIFAAITNTITEVSSGMYTIASGFTQTEMNADVITLKFDASGCDTRIISILTN